MRIFYSWQSDSPNGTNRGYIQKCLVKAVSELRTKHPSVAFVIEQDARGAAGSRPLVTMLLAKISGCEAFVGDLTTINPKSRSRKTPNPNVLYELGFADGVLGDDRVLLLFNKAVGGRPEELPFDLRGRAIMVYSREPGRANSDEAQLVSQLKDALDAVYNLGPVPMPESARIAQARQHDLKWLNVLFERIQTRLLDLFFEDANLGQIRDPVVDMAEELEGLARHSAFVFSDKKLDHNANAFISSLVRAVSISTNIMEPMEKGRYKQILPMGMFRNEEEEKDRQSFCRAVKRTHTAFKILLRYAREKYPEINIEDTDTKARARYGFPV